MLTRLIAFLVYLLTVAVVIKGFSTKVLLSKKILTEESNSTNIELIRDSETNITLLETLKEASDQNNGFSYTGQEFDNLGFYIESIGGLYENKTEGTFWMIYKVDESGEHSIPEGVSSTIVSSGEHYLFWYQKYEHDTSFSSKLFQGFTSLLFICCTFLISVFM